MKRFARGGRSPSTRGEMNGAEKAYAAQLEERRVSGEIEWWAYEPFNLRLAKRTYYKPDFGVMLADGELQVHEVKGHFEHDAKVRVKVAAETFPFRFFLVRKRSKRDGGGFEVSEVCP